MINSLTDNASHNFAHTFISRNTQNLVAHYSREAFVVFDHVARQ